MTVQSDRVVFLAPTCDAGTTYTFTNQFDRAFMNAGGQVVLTNDTSYNPGADPRLGGVNWQQMQRLDPFRRN